MTQLFSIATAECTQPTYRFEAKSISWSYNIITAPNIVYFTIKLTTYFKVLLHKSNLGKYLGYSLPLQCIVGNILLFINSRTGVLICVHCGKSTDLVFHNSQIYHSYGESQRTVVVIHTAVVFEK